MYHFDDVKLLFLIYKTVHLILFQLYEIDDNPKRKEFLDELFSYMQKRGKCISFKIINFLDLQNGPD